MPAPRHAQKRLARRSLRESKRPGEVWLPSSTSNPAVAGCNSNKAIMNDCLVRRWAITHHVNVITLFEDGLPDEASRSLNDEAKSGGRRRVRGRQRAAQTHADTPKR